MARSRVTEPSNFQRHFAKAISGPVKGRIRVYRNTVAAGMINALRDNFPIVERLVGQEMFDAIALDHAFEHPPQSPVLALYGDQFPSWIANQQWVDQIPYLADVARVEWLRIKSLFAADEPALTFDQLRGVQDWQSATFKLHPAAQFDWLSTPAMTLWHRHQGEFSGDTDIEWVAEGALFTRASMRVCPTPIDKAHFLFLSAIQMGKTIAEAAMETARHHPDENVASLMMLLVDAGAFAQSAGLTQPGSISL
jgi:hypothetical protein